MTRDATVGSGGSSPSQGRWRDPWPCRPPGTLGRWANHWGFTRNSWKNHGKMEGLHGFPNDFGPKCMVWPCLTVWHDFFPKMYGLPYHKIWLTWVVYQGFGLQEHHKIAKNHGWLTLIYHGSELSTSIVRWLWMANTQLYPMATWGFK